MHHREINGRSYFVAEKNLPVGSYTYKYIVDDQWMIDVDQPYAANGYGNFDNKCEVVPLMNFTKEVNGVISFRL